MTAGTTRSNCATATAISSGRVCHSRVEPSTSARSSVTVPCGSTRLSLTSLQPSVWVMLSSIGRSEAENIRECAYIRLLLPVIVATTGDERQVDGGQKSRRRSAHVGNGVDDAGGRGEDGS